MKLFLCAEFGLVSIWVFINLLLLKSAPCAGDSSVVNPCCYYPCQNSGVCVRFGTDGYQCDCTRTGFYGDNCTVPEFWTRIRLMLKPKPSTVHFILTHFQWFWDLVNNSFLQDTFMRLVLTVRSDLIPSPPTYNTKYGYLAWESYYNISYYTRLLPPVPEDCPLPMGTKGKSVLPDPKVMAERFFRRNKFRPDPQGTNLMFAFMAQHFTHQFFKTNNDAQGGFTKALGHGVDASNIYGDNLMRQLQLRLHKDGKLKYQLVNGEMYPPTVSEVPVHMVYPEGIPPEKRLVIGQEIFGILPGLTMYATIWLREHNRVCDILKAEHPTWDDEQLFQTTRLIIIERFQYSNRIALEFGHLYHWHPLMPDSFLIDGHEILYSQFIYNTSLLMNFGVEKLVDAFSRQPAGQIGGGRNSPEIVVKVAEMVIRESRATRVRPFNEYRKRFNLKPYTSFYEFTDDMEMARGLEELYGDIDALEFYPGVLLEKTRANAIFGESMVEMGAPFSLKGLLGNPICSPEYWKPSTFGGETGFDIIKTSTLKKLVCLNTKWCPYVDFHVPRNEEAAEPKKPSTEL
ncbi:prostaglandin G/H synthase 1 isoform X3 [Acanthopagrus latus]|uniref:prostaglandin G/H synthase 1 isoform X3 n=1 Tax=Acanthopagrus latus TaxID=8177 RepID=UPI00187C3724|nr:prostaglandin G/H synthase 1 isoform X3 [Acanthopagrus latus]